MKRSGTLTTPITGLLVAVLLVGMGVIKAKAQSFFRQTGIQLLTKQEGLSNNTLTEIYQDKDGFLWLGTDVGLSRYDGIHFHNYNSASKEPHSITGIYETSDKMIWSRITNLNTLSCFDKMRGCYMPLTSSTPEVLEDIHDLCVVKDRIYAITSQGAVELKAEYEIDKMNITPAPLPNIKGTPSKFYGYNNSLYILTRENKLIFYNLTEKKGESLDCTELGITNAEDIDNIHIYNEYLWICSHNNGVLCYDTITKAARKLDKGDHTHSVQDACVRDIIQADDTTFVMASGTSLALVKFENKEYLKAPIKIINLIENDIYYEPIIKNRITRIYLDKQSQVLWVGTFGRGLLKLNLLGDNVNRIQLDNEIRSLNGIAEDSNGCIWLATDNKGIYKSQTKSLSPNIQFLPWEKADKNGDYCLFKDKNGHLWFGDEKGDILLMKPTTNEIVSFHPQPEETDNQVSAIKILFLNSRNDLWIATENALMVYDHQGKNCLAYMPYTKEIEKITAICEDGDGTMWLGTAKGLFQAVREGKKVTLSGGYEQKNNLVPGKVMAIYMNNYNQLFVSYANKIIQIDGKEKNVVSTMLLDRDLPNGHIDCMVDDRNGNTWLGTNSGIITVNNKNNSFYLYAFPENYYQVCRLNNGKLLWVNSTGLLYFDPRQLKETSSNRKYYIADIDVNYNKVEIGEKVNGQVILDKPAHLIDRLTLNYNNNNLVLYLSDLRYGTSPNKVEYRLLPNDKEWRFGDYDQVRLSNIKPGDYILEIKPSYPIEGNEQITRIAITVGKYWATTGWAVAGYILIIIISIFLTWLYLNRKALKRQLYKEKEVQMKERLEEATEIRAEEKKNQQMRDQIRYMLARELRTPLSLVTAPLKEMIDNSALPESFLQKVKVAYRNSICMQDICNQLLNIHQEENYGPTLNVAPYAASRIADEVVRSSYELLNVSPINLYYDKDNKINAEIWIDWQKIMFVLKNIMSNAYRHISYAGAVRFIVSTTNLKGKEYCLFTIEDDGKEVIEESSVTYLGEDTYISPSNYLHPELGIEIMRRTALDHHGDIQIKQDKETGTSVTLYIPLGKKHFEGEEYVVFVKPGHMQVDDSQAKIITVEDKKKQELQDSIIPRPIESPETKYKILVIEDHADIRLYLKVLFGGTYNIIMAENGEEGVKIARKEIPDLIITDVMMPVMDGFECCRILKEDLKTCHIPIILLTALVGDEDVVKGIELGADDYILKPFNPEILRTKVKRLIKSRVELKQIYTKLLMPSISTIGDTQEENEIAIEIEDPFVTQILKIVNDNLQNQDFNVKKLAEMLNMSQPTLYRRVKQLTNFTIIELVRGVRLKRSAELLRTKKYSVQEVAEMVGYNDIPTFRKHFVDFYGTTPSTFNSKEETEDKK